MATNANKGHRRWGHISGVVGKEISDKDRPRRRSRNGGKYFTRFVDGLRSRFRAFAIAMDVINNRGVPRQRKYPTIKRLIRLNTPFGAPKGMTYDGQSVMRSNKSAGDKTLIRVTEPAVLPLAADFSGVPLAGNMPLTVVFTNTSTNANTYLWEFGDGNTSTATSPTHTYTTDGPFEVKLTATGAGGATDVKIRSNYVTVTNPKFSITLKYDYSESPGGAWVNNHTRAQEFSIASMGQSDVEFYVIGTGHPHTHDYVQERARVRNLSLIDAQGREEVLVMKAYLQNVGEFNANNHPRWQYHGLGHANNGAVWNAAGSNNGLNHPLVKWRSDTAFDGLGHSFPATMRTMGNGGTGTGSGGNGTAVGALLAVLVDLPEFELIDPTDPSLGWKFK